MLNRILKKSKDLAAINSKGNCENPGKPGLSGVITLKTGTEELKTTAIVESRKN
jgi:hypothetical protein